MFSDLSDQTVIAVTGAVPGSDAIDLLTATGRSFRLYHEDDCCESVTVEDVAGDVADLLGTPILHAVETSSSDHQTERDQDADSFTWTFYRLTTIKGTVVIRWLGISNGYYSEAVTFTETTA